MAMVLQRARITHDNIKGSGDTGNTTNPSMRFADGCLLMTSEMTAIPKAVRVTIIAAENGRYRLLLSDATVPGEHYCAPEGGVETAIEPGEIVIGEVALNKAIVRYLRDIFLIIEDDLPEEG